MKVGIYARISRDEQGEGLGVARQVEDCLALCMTKRWNVVGRYVDNDISAFSGRPRPRYRSLLEGLTSGAIDMVVAYAPERLHRSPVELEEFIELIERTGASVETVRAGAWDLSTSHGRLTARMLGAVSRAESERTGERVRRAHRQAKESGRWRGPIPFGMKQSTTPGLPESDPDQSPIVIELLERVTRGDALTAIAADLTRRGLRPRRGSRWTHSGVLRLLQSPALGGLVELDGAHHVAAFTGVVTPEEWHIAQAALARRPRGESKRPREKLTLLGGLLVCDQHDFSLYGASALHAPTYQAAGPGLCYVAITRAAADDYVRALVLGRLGRDDAADLLVIERPPDGSEAEAADLRRRRDDLLDFIAEGLIQADVARPQLRVLGERLAAIERPRGPALLDAAVLRDPQDAWERWSQVQRRALVRLLFERLSLVHVGPASGPKADPTRIKVAWVGQS